MHCVDKAPSFELEVELLSGPNCLMPSIRRQEPTSGKALPRTDSELENLFERLSKSIFRSRFHLDAAERQTVERLGLDVLRRHAHEIISKRLAKAVIANDGRQTPMRGYPVFKAQHATGLCCRGCMKKWYGIEKGRELTPQEIAWAADLIVRWIARDIRRFVSRPNAASQKTKTKTLAAGSMRQRELDLL